MIILALQILGVLLLVSIGIYLEARRWNKYWQKQGIAGPKPVPLKGNLDKLFSRKPAIFQLFEWTKQFGPVYGVQWGRKNVLVVSDPEMANELLVTKFDYFYGRMGNPLDGDVDKQKLINMFAAKGKRWKRLRTTANPAFSISNLKRVMPTIEDSIRVTMDLLEKEVQKENPINLHTYFTEMSLDVISRVALGQRESRQFNSEFGKLAIATFEDVNNTWWDYYSSISPWFGRNVLRPIIMFAGQLFGISNVSLIWKMMEVVKERKREKENGDRELKEKRRNVDFIDMFLDVEANDNELVVNGQDAADQRLNRAEMKCEKKNTIEEIVMNCFLFLLAGFDTTANSLSIVAHNLANHPEVQERLLEEIEAICGDDEMPSYEQLSNMKYAEAVLKETLRLCPIAAAVVDRMCAETTTLGKYTVEKGTTVKLDLFSLHRNKSVWGEDAEQFRPERWLEGNQPTNAFFAFGGGPRICIGMRLALIEEKMTLVKLLRRYRIQKCAQTEKYLEFTGQAVLNPKKVTIKLESR